MPRQRNSDQPEADPQKVDLTRFISVEDAIRQANAVRAKFDGLAKQVAEANDRNFTLLALFILSAVARVNGLHIGTIHAIETSNPHAAIPLIRSYADVVVTTLYVRDHPDYVDALTSRRAESKRKRRTIGALVTAVTRYAPGAKNVYDELSEGTHFGAVAMWAPWTLKGERTLSYATYPRWRDPETEPLVIAAWLIELGDAFIETVESMVARYLN